MNARDRVLEAFAHNEPDRVPRWCGASEEFWTRAERILFNGAIDSQHVLIEGGSPGFVREKTRQVLEIMAPGGAYVAGASHDTILNQTPLENVLAMFDAIEEFGVYHQNSKQSSS